MKELLKLAEQKGFDDWIGEEYLDLCLIQKWLREEHGFHVEVCFMRSNTTQKIYEVYIETKNGWIDCGECIENFQEALKKGIKEGLKLI